MANFNIYDESENIISSDEDSVEYEDYILNVATTSKNNSTVVSNKPVNRKESCINRRKLSILAKKKSIKWLNGKKERQKYKEIISKIKNSSKKIISTQQAIGNDEILNTETNQHININAKSKETVVEPMETNLNVIDSVPEQNTSKIFNGLPTNIERSRSMSPTLLKSSTKDMCSKMEITNNVMLYKEINKLFPKHNKALESIVRSSSDTAEKIEQKITQTLLEIQALSEMIQTKELEWNKLLHLRKVKEEIILHLVRKKNVMELKDKRSNKANFNSYDIKNSQLDTIRSSTEMFTENKFATTVHSLVESRANMRREDLDKEQLNINRLHSILVSGNILPSNHQYDSHKLDVTIKSEAECKHQSEGLRDVKRIITEFRQKDTDIRLKPTERKKSTGQEVNFRNNAENTHNSISMYHRDEILNKQQNYSCSIDKKGDLKKSDVPLCQACGTNVAQFVCAGCGNQWYCSRRCQVSAWDKHSDICKE